MSDALGFRADVQGGGAFKVERKVRRRALNKGAAVVRAEARRLVSRRAVSAPGEAPGMQTGALRRAVGTVSKGSKGGWIKVGVRTIKGSIFYPAFLFYGSPKTGLEKRANFVAQALNNVQPAVKTVISQAVRDSVTVRPK